MADTQGTGREANNHQIRTFLGTNARFSILGADAIVTFELQRLEIGQDANIYQLFTQG
jgi:hypothetical protein